MASKMGVKPGYLRHIVNGSMRPSARVKEDLERILGVPAQVLFKPVDPNRLIAS